ncbi:SRPBCC domain-containing protein [Sulfuricaulis sp.]|uniref:SRPBCC family protein n=1 Tax=Sulfuricaulis sp. TaxID=2003553 RepID=UPI00355AC110
MPDILHRVGIKTTPEKVFEALATVEGLSHWWIADTAGDAKQGGIILFGFSDMKVVELKPNKLVKWKCVRGPKEWVDTDLTYQLVPKDDQTFVLFTHAHWKEPVEFMHHCSTKWATFLLSLKDWLERAEGRPAPYDVKIHAGD